MIVQTGRKYKNIKNQKLYRVEGIAKHSEPPNEWMVFYRALYDCESKNRFWVRPFDLFCEKFEEVEPPLNPKDFLILK